eukprot:71492-Amphidinium_carterae.1
MSRRSLLPLLILHGCRVALGTRWATIDTVLQNSLVDSNQAVLPNSHPKKDSIELLLFAVISDFHETLSLSLESVIIRITPLAPDVPQNIKKERKKTNASQQMFAKEIEYQNKSLFLLAGSGVPKCSTKTLQNKASGSPLTRALRTIMGIHH